MHRIRFFLMIRALVCWSSDLSKLNKEGKRSCCVSWFVYLWKSQLLSQLPAWQTQQQLTISASKLNETVCVSSQNPLKTRDFLSNVWLLFFCWFMKWEKTTKKYRIARMLKCFYRLLWKWIKKRPPWKFEKMWNLFPPKLWKKA